DLKDSAGVTYLQGVINRVNAVANSLKMLIKLLSKTINTTSNNADPGLVLLDSAITQSTKLITDLLGSTTPEQALENLIKDIAVFPIDTLVALFKSAQKQQLWSWTALPSMLPVGQLNAWLNDPNYYPADPSKVVERQFRVRMVAAADAYIRH